MRIQDFYESALSGYSRIDPRDRQDTEAHLSQETAEAITKLASSDAKVDAEGAQLFGLRTRRDDSLPFGAVRFVTENEQDRALRRAAKGGMSINVVKIDDLTPFPAPPPAPTLRALVRHWLEKVKDR